MSIASCRQSCIVWRTSGWSGISRSPGEVLGAGDLVGEHRGRAGPRRCMRCSCGGTLRPPRSAAARATIAAYPAPARGEHRRVEHRLHQHAVARCSSAGSARRSASGKLCAVGERQHDRVLGGRRLQLEVERAAEALAQRQAPGAVDAAAERRVDDELHAAGFVEEALEHDACRCVGSAPSAARAGAQVVDELRGRRRRRSAELLDQPAQQPVAPRRIERSRARRRRASATPRPTARRCGRAPRRARTGSSAAAPCASSTRTRAALDAQDPVATCCRAGRRRRPGSRPRSPR